MSLFDVLRYPISNSPTENELLGLPEPLFAEWLYKVHWIGQLGGDIYSNLHLIVGTYYSSKQAHEDIVLLRKMVVEYESI